MGDVASKELLTILIKAERVKGQGYMIMFISAKGLTNAHTNSFINELWAVNSLLLLSSNTSSVIT